MLDGFGKGCDQFGLEEWITQAALQILASEAPGEWFFQSGVRLQKSTIRSANSFRLVQSWGASTLRWRMEK